MYLLLSLQTDIMIAFSLFFSRVKELHELVETTEKAAQVTEIFNLMGY